MRSWTTRQKLMLLCTYLSVAFVSFYGGQIQREVSILRAENADRDGRLALAELKKIDLSKPTSQIDALLGKANPAQTLVDRIKARDQIVASTWGTIVSTGDRFGSWLGMTVPEDLRAKLQPLDTSSALSTGAKTSQAEKPETDQTAKKESTLASSGPGK